MCILYYYVDINHSIYSQGYYVGHRLSNSKNSFSFQTFEFANEASRKHQVSITKLEYVNFLASAYCFILQCFEIINDWLHTRFFMLYT